MSEPITIIKQVLKKQVNEGWKKDKLAEHYNLSKSQIEKALKDANLRIRNFHNPKYILVDSEESAEVSSDTNLQEIPLGHISEEISPQNRYSENLSEEEFIPTSESLDTNESVEEIIFTDEIEMEDEQSILEDFQSVLESEEEEEESLHITEESTLESFIDSPLLTDDGFNNSNMINTLRNNQFETITYLENNIENNSQSDNNNDTEWV